ncbi:MAG: hypothetical protein KC475_03815 [Cyanobacteria bacterium HKST-UBA03]|nr:hypothetical protein [Cyanobacteria bacterium HKST-UBA03]
MSVVAFSPHPLPTPLPRLLRPHFGLGKPGPDPNLAPPPPQPPLPKPPDFPNGVGYDEFQYFLAHGTPPNDTFLERANHPEGILLNRTGTEIFSLSEVSPDELLYFLNHGKTPNDSFSSRLENPKTTIEGYSHHYLRQFVDTLRTHRQEMASLAGKCAWGAVANALLIAVAANLMRGAPANAVVGLLAAPIGAGMGALGWCFKALSRRSQASTGHIEDPHLARDLDGLALLDGNKPSDQPGYRRFAHSANLLLTIARERHAQAKAQAQDGPGQTQYPPKPKP